MQIVARILVALLALVGSGSAGFLAVLANQSMTDAERKICQQTRLPSMKEVLKLSETLVAAQLHSDRQVQEFNLAMENYFRVSWGIWFLFAACGLGLFGMILAMCGNGFSAAAVLLTAAIGPIVIMPTLTLPLIAMFTCPLPVAGLLAFCVHPRRRDDFEE